MVMAALIIPNTLFISLVNLNVKALLHKAQSLSLIKIGMEILQNAQKYFPDILSLSKGNHGFTIFR